MTLIRHTDATAEPCTAAEVKRQMKETLVDATNDTDIEAMITVARHAAEERMRRSILSETWKLYLPCFYEDTEGPLILPMPRLIAVSSVKYYDADNALQTLSSSNYIAISNVEPAAIIEAPSCYWPTTYDRPDAVEVTYTAGYGTQATAVPQAIKQWVMMAATFLYMNRGGSGEIPVLPADFAVALLEPHKVYGS